MRTITHPNCVKLIDVVETRPCLHLVLEYVEGCDLFEKIQMAGTFSEEDARLVMVGVTEAVKVRCDRPPFLARHGRRATVQAVSWWLDNPAGSDGPCMLMQRCVSSVAITLERSMFIPVGSSIET